jgi:hypothetical protein
MKSNFLLIILVFYSIKVQSQINCYTHSGYPDLLSGQSLTLSNQGPYMIRVFAHIIRKSDGTGGISINDLAQSIQILKQDFEAHNICISFSGYDYIDNSNYYFGDWFPQIYNQIFYTNVKANCINIYYLPPTNPQPGGIAAGIPETKLLVSGSWPADNYYQCNNTVYVGTTKIISHELGHCLGLFHTHHGSPGVEDPAGSCQELPNGSLPSSNCATCGDYVCDTPADPGLNFQVYCNNCEWDNPDPGTFSSYDPDEYNIMSYSRHECFQYFSIGQGERMRNHSATNAILQQIKVPDILYLQNKSFTQGQPFFASLKGIYAGKDLGQGAQGPLIVSNSAKMQFRTNDFIDLKAGFLAEPGNDGFFHADLSSVCSVTDNINLGRQSGSFAYHPMLDSSRWLYGLATFDGVLFSNFYTDGDTIISGIKYQKIMKQEAQIPGFPGGGGSSTGYFGYFREDTVTRKVYKRFANTETLQFDFSLTAGDPMPTFPAFTLTNVDSVMTNAGYRKRFVFQDANADTIIWLEGIGNLCHPLIPHSYCPISATLVTNHLICSHQHNQLIYDAGNQLVNIGCGNLNINDSEKPEVSDINIFPNPSVSELRIEAAGDYPEWVMINDITGRTIYSLACENKIRSILIDCSNWQSGIYFVKVAFKNKEVIKKFIRIE